ncbi:MAG TPA: serine hydrolase domain-containing protein [Puia sp.]|nr:serine hydrolase domain-containing protein [Puia sp.]
MKAALFLAIALGSWSLATAQAPTPDSLRAKLDVLFQSYNRHDGPGCAVAIISKGKVIFTGGYGMANLEYDIPITPSSIFDIASVSKQFTGWAISTLIQEGKISPDDDIRRYLPDVPSFGKPITIRHLLNHISGIRDWPMTLNLAGWRWDEVFSFQDIMRMVKYQKELDFPPGERFSYSNTGYNLLAAIVEKVSGQSFREWTDEHLFRPLEMPSSHFLDDHRKIVRGLAYSYSQAGEGFIKEPDALTAMGSSSLFTSVDDLCKWVIHFQQGMKTKDPVVTRMLEDGVLNDGSRTRYGYGLGLDADRGVPTVSHTGGWAGYRTIITNYPDDELSIILLSNTSDFDVHAWASRIADLFLSKKFMSAAPKPESIATLPTTTVGASLLQKYSGTYQLGPGWAVTLTVENCRLMTQANGEDKFPMEAKSDSVFWISAYGASMTFMKDPEGKVNLLHYKTIYAKRITPWRPATGNLTQYAGTYYSNELATEYIVDTAGNRLMLHHRRLGDFVLEPDPTREDQFGSSPGSFFFVRDVQQKITGFRVSGGRVKNLWFDKTH